MRWHWTRRRHTPQAVTHGHSRPWLEALEERGSPSVFHFNGLADAPLVRFREEELFRSASQSGPSTMATRPPVIVDFYASEGADGWWTFSGRVNTASPGGLIVSFGGLETLQGQTTAVNENGTFRLTIQLRNCEGGLATAQTSDWDGQVSEVVEDYVHRTTCRE